MTYQLLRNIVKAQAEIARAEEGLTGEIEEQILATPDVAEIRTSVLDRFLMAPCFAHTMQSVNVLG